MDHSLWKIMIVCKCCENSVPDDAEVCPYCFSIVKEKKKTEENSASGKRSLTKSPAQPTQPAQVVRSAQSAQPTQAVQPTQSAQSAQTARPAQPGEAVPPQTEIPAGDSGCLFWIIALLVIVAVFVIIVVSCVSCGIKSLKQKKATALEQATETVIDHNPSEAVISEKASEKTQASEKTSEKLQASEKASESVTVNVPIKEASEEEKANSDYIMPFSNSRYVEEKDMEGMTLEELRLARNELYARHGRRFKDEALQAYFDSKDWYNGTIDPDDFTGEYTLAVFNEYEYQNKDIILNYENKLKGR